MVPQPWGLEPCPQGSAVSPAGAGAAGQRCRAGRAEKGSGGAPLHGWAVVLHSPVHTEPAEMGTRFGAVCAARRVLARLALELAPELAPLVPLVPALPTWAGGSRVLGGLFDRGNCVLGGSRVLGELFWGSGAGQGQLAPAAVPAAHSTRAGPALAVEVVSPSLPPAAAGWIFRSYLRR